MLEAQDYVGGRIRQNTDFIKGINIDVGAEFLHGATTPLTRFAKENDEPLQEIFCWAQGDGGPVATAVNNGYGLYYIADNSGRKRLLRYDDTDDDFVTLNSTLWGMANLDECAYTDATSVHNFLADYNFGSDMICMAQSGFANTLCTNLQDLSLKQTIRWLRLWHEECEEDGDYRFVHSFKGVVDKLSADLNIQTSCPVVNIKYPLDKENLVTLTTADGRCYSCRNAVITASPHVLRSDRISFEPTLSESLQQALRSVHMHNAVKVVMKFSARVWPKDLHGMVVSDESLPMPEIWFMDVAAHAAADEPARAFAVGFLTADYADRFAKFSREKGLRRCVQQLDDMFALLEPRHMAADLAGADIQSVLDLRKPSDMYLDGMVYAWNPETHPFIGGGYCSPKANGSAVAISELLKPLGSHVFFAGEAANLPGATSHAALESGLRAARQVQSSLLERHQD